MRVTIIVEEGLAKLRIKKFNGEEVRQDLADTKKAVRKLPE